MFCVYFDLVKFFLLYYIFDRKNIIVVTIIDNFKRKNYQKKNPLNSFFFCYITVVKYIYIYSIIQTKIKMLSDDIFHNILILLSTIIFGYIIYDKFFNNNNGKQRKNVNTKSYSTKDEKLIK